MAERIVPAAPLPPDSHSRALRFFNQSLATATSQALSAGRFTNQSEDVVAITSLIVGEVNNARGTSAQSNASQQLMVNVRPSNAPLWSRLLFPAAILSPLPILAAGAAGATEKRFDLPSPVYLGPHDSLQVRAAGSGITVNAQAFGYRLRGVKQIPKPFYSPRILWTNGTGTTTDVINLDPENLRNWGDTEMIVHRIFIGLGRTGGNDDAVGNLLTLRIKCDGKSWTSKDQLIPIGGLRVNSYHSSIPVPDVVIKPDSMFQITARLNVGGVTDILDVAVVGSIDVRRT